MLKRNSFLLMLIVGLSLIFTSCQDNKTTNIQNTNALQTNSIQDDKAPSDMKDVPPDIKGAQPDMKDAPPDANGERPPEPPHDEKGAPPDKKENHTSIEYKSVNHYMTNETIDELVLSSENEDESAVLVDGGAKVVLNDFEITRKNNKSKGGDEASFYGVGAATLVTNGVLNLNEGTITTNANGGAGVFAYGSGVANVNGVTIDTKKGTSGGIHVAGGGTLTASELVVNTAGESSAPIRSDRGGGTMTINGGSFTSNGSGSPAIYCTADITVNDATLIANNSEGICIEGLNTVTLNDAELTSNMPDQNQNDNTWSIIVYQSMSGDSKIGKGTFNMNNGVLTSKNGGIFYTTNTESEFNINSVEINPSPNFEYLLRATGNQNKRGWGNIGSNGAKCVFNAIEQEMSGKIIYDSISTLDLNLTKGTIYTGYIVKDDSSAGGASSDGYANVTIDNQSEWIVTNDSYINILTVNDSANFEEHIKDEKEKEVKIVDAVGNVLRDGESNIKITVNELKLQ